MILLDKFGVVIVLYNFVEIFENVIYILTIIVIFWKNNKIFKGIFNDF